MAKGVTFWTKQKVKQNGRRYKNSSQVGQIDCKIMKEKSKLLAKCFVNSFRKNPPISARNVPKLPEMSLFEPRKKVPTLFCDFSLGSKSDILGSPGAFSAHIGGFFLNELANHLRSNLIFFFLFLWSIDLAIQYVLKMC